jgi:hypothetical protein
MKPARPILQAVLSGTVMGGCVFGLSLAACAVFAPHATLIGVEGPVGPDLNNQCAILLFGVIASLGVGIWRGRSVYKQLSHRDRQSA